MAARTALTDAHATSITGLTSALGSESGARIAGDATLTTAVSVAQAAATAAGNTADAAADVAEAAAASAAAAGDAAAAAQATADAALPRSGGIMTGSLTLAGPPTGDLHSATKAYVDSADSDNASAAQAAQDTADAALPRDGGTMSGPLTLAGAPASDLQAATKAYVDTSSAAVAGALASEVLARTTLTDSLTTEIDALYVAVGSEAGQRESADDVLTTAAAAAQATADAALPKAGVTMTGALTLAGAPTVDLHAVTKLYVDGSDASNAAAAQAAQDTADAALPKAGGTITGPLILSALRVSTSYDDDAAAASGGVQVGEMYRNGNFVMVRLS